MRISIMRKSPVSDRKKKSPGSGLKSMSLFSGEEDDLQQKVQKLLKEKQESENEFSLKRAKFMELFKQKEGKN